MSNDDCPNNGGKKSVRMHAHHFHLSTLDVSEKGKTVLKIGACPIANLTAQALKSKAFKKNKNMPSLVQIAEGNLQLCSISSYSPSKKIETEDDASSNHRHENDNENATFKCPCNSIESSIMQAGMKAERFKEGGVLIKTSIVKKISCRKR